MRSRVIFEGFETGKSKRRKLETHLCAGPSIRLSSRPEGLREPPCPNPVFRVVQKALNLATGPVMNALPHSTDLKGDGIEAQATRSMSYPNLSHGTCDLLWDYLLSMLSASLSLPRPSAADCSASLRVGCQRPVCMEPSRHRNVTVDWYCQPLPVGVSAKVFCVIGQNPRE